MILTHKASIHMKGQEGNLQENLGSLIDLALLQQIFLNPAVGVLKVGRTGSHSTVGRNGSHITVGRNGSHHTVGNLDFPLLAQCLLLQPGVERMNKIHQYSKNVTSS